MPTKSRTSPLSDTDLNTVIEESEKQLKRIDGIIAVVKRLLAEALEDTARMDYLEEHGLYAVPAAFNKTVRQRIDEKMQQLSDIQVDQT